MTPRGAVTVLTTSCSSAMRPMTGGLSCCFISVSMSDRNCFSFGAIFSSGSSSVSRKLLRAFSGASAPMPRAARPSATPVPRSPANDAPSAPTANAAKVAPPAPLAPGLPFIASRKASRPLPLRAGLCHLAKTSQRSTQPLIFSR